MREAVELLRVERVGHGLTAARDPEVMALLRDRGIPLEGCPGSNASIGLISGFGDYPLRTFLDAGVTLTLNSDDPALFGTSIVQEFRRATAEFSLSAAEAEAICENAVRVAFLPELQKQRLLKEIEQAMAA